MLAEATGDSTMAVRERASQAVTSVAELLALGFTFLALGLWLIRAERPRRRAGPNERVDTE